MQLRQGYICWTVVTPEKGKPKRRPVIAIMTDDEIHCNEFVRGVAITTTFRRPLATDQIELPWERSGNCATRLRRPSVAVCNWIDRVHRDDVEEVRGSVPPDILLQILDRVKRIDEESRQSNRG